MIGDSLSYLRRFLFLNAGVTDDYVVFGSTALFLRGIRTEESVGDLDVFVSRRAWGVLLGMGGEFTVETPRADDPPYLCYHLDTPIHVFYEWTARDVEWITARECFEQAEEAVFDGGPMPGELWQVIPVQLVRQHKLQGHLRNVGSPAHEKHLHDLKLIDEYLWSIGRVPPHHYYPNYEAMGDCTRCGHVEESAVHEVGQIGY